MTKLNATKVVAVLLWGCAAGALADNSEALFEQHEFATGFPSPQTVVVGSFGAAAANAAEARIAVAHVDADGKRRLRLFGFEGAAWAPVVDAELRRDAAFIDVATMGSRDRLIVYGGGRFTGFDVAAGKERPLLTVASSYKADWGEMPFVDVTRDIDLDGRDDLVLPGLHGFSLAMAKADGSYTDVVKIGPPEPFLNAVPAWEDRLYRRTGITSWTIPWYQSRVHVLDYDRDGRRDLVFWNQDHFEVHRQTGPGTFAETPTTFGVDMPFDSDGLYSLIFAFRGETRTSLLTGFKDKRTRTVVHSFGEAGPADAPRSVRCRVTACYSDLNGDGVADLVTMSMAGRSVLGQHTRYAVHFGREQAPAPGAAGHIRFPATADTAIASAGMQSLQPHDVDGDGVVEIMAHTVDFRVRKLLRAMLPGGMATHVDFYRLEDGAYPAQPTARRTLRAGLFRGFSPPVLLGDVTGDGRSDLLLGKSRKRLDVYVGAPAPALFAEKPQAVQVALPGAEQARLADLNDDGKQDVLLHHAAEEGTHRLIVLHVR